MDEKIVCPHCQYQYQRAEISGTLSLGKYLCFLGCGKRFSEYPNHVSKLRNLRVYQVTETFIKHNTLTSLIILLTSLIFIVIGITISTSEDRYFKIAMNSIDLEEIESSVVKISDMDKLDLICQRCQKNSGLASQKASISKDIKDQETTNKWALAALACLNQKQAMLLGQLKKPLNKFTYDPPIFLPLIIIFSVITTGIILFIKFGLSRFIGIFLIVIGLFGLIISFTMRTTINDTYNIGLLSEKHNLIMISLAIALAGIIIQAVGYFSKNKNQKADK